MNKKPTAPVEPEKQTSSFWKDNSRKILLLISVVSVILGLHGYWKVLGFSLSYYNILDLLYHTAQMFLLEANLDATTAVPIELSIARVLAPLSLGFAAWETVAALFKERFSLSSLKNHVIICGLGERGFELAKGYIKANTKVLVVEADAENDLISSCKAHGALVIIGDATEGVVLRKARLKYSRSVYAISGDDGNNFEIGAKVTRELGKITIDKVPNVNCYIAANNVLLSDISPYSQMFRDTSKSGSTRIVRINDLAARKLFQDYPLDRKIILPSDTTIIHIIIIGFGSMGESVLLQAVRMGHFANGSKLQISVFDQNASRKSKLLLQTISGLSQCSTLNYYDVNFDSYEFGEKISELIINKSTIPYIVFCLNNTMLSVSLALRIRTITNDKTIPFYLRLNDNSGLGVLLNKIDTIGKEKNGDTLNIYGFGLIKETCSPDVFENWQLDTLAKALFDNYKKRQHGSKIQNEEWLQKSFEKIDTTHRDHFRQEADHLPVKLRACGYKINNFKDIPETKRIKKFSPDEVMILAKMEHNRYCAELWISGWKYDSTYSNKLRTTPVLVSWETLTKSEQQNRYQLLQDIPAVLETLQFAICKNS
jgi:voltage-gated potassium channel Kch